MKFSCEKTILNTAVSTAMRAVSSKSSIPALEGLLITTKNGLITICGYNMSTGIETTIEAEVQKEGTIVVNAKLFGEIIRKMPDDVVNFTLEKQTITLVCGDCRFEIPSIPPEDFPELPEIEEEFSFSIQQNVLRKMISETLFAVSTNEARPIHTGALFEVNQNGLTMVALDGFRLALRREKVNKIEGGAFQFVAPGNALSEVEKICSDSEELSLITLGNRHLLFEMNNTKLICRKLEGEFLDYKNAVPRNNQIFLTVDTKTMMSSIDRVSVVINEKLKSPIRCEFKEDKVTFSAKTANGESEDICPVSGDGQGLVIGFNNRYLLEALRNAPADSVKMELSSGISPAILVPAEGEENFLYMVLPVRLKG